MTHIRQEFRLGLAGGLGTRDVASKLQALSMLALQQSIAMTDDQNQNAIGDRGDGNGDDDQPEGEATKAVTSS
jgi:hypothetical protein